MGKWAGHKKNPGSNIKLVLKRKAETDEWVVAWYENGKYSEAKTYYTNDKQDAIDTMAFLKKKYGIAQANPYALQVYGEMKRANKNSEILYKLLDWLIVHDKLPYPGKSDEISYEDYTIAVETNKNGDVFMDVMQLDQYDNEIFSGYGTIPKWEIKYVIEQLDREHKLPKNWGYSKNPSRQFYGRSEVFGPTCPKCKTPRMLTESTWSGQKYTCAKCGHSFDSYHPNPKRGKRNPTELCKKCGRRPAGPLGICSDCMKHLYDPPAHLRGYFKKNPSGIKFLPSLFEDGDKSFWMVRILIPPNMNAKHVMGVLRTGHSQALWVLRDTKNFSAPMKKYGGYRVNAVSSMKYGRDSFIADELLRKLEASLGGAQQNPEWGMCATCEGTGNRFGAKCTACGGTGISVYCGRPDSEQNPQGRRSTMEANPRRVRGVPTIRAAELISGLSPGFLYLIQRVIKNYKPGQYGQYQLWPTDMGVEVRDKISHKVKFFIHYNLSRRIDDVIEDFETRYSYHKPKIVYSRALLHKFEPALEPAIVEYKDITIPQKKEHELKANKTYVYWIEKKMKIPWTQYLLLTPEEQAKLEYEFDRVLHLRRYRPEKKTKNYVIEKTDSYAIGISILPGKVYRGWIGNEAGIKYSSAYRFVEQALEWIEARGYTIPEKVKRMLKRALPSIPVLESQPHIPMPKAKRAELKTFEPTESGAVEEDIMKNAQANPSTPMPSQKAVETAVMKAEEFHDMPPKGLKKVKVPNLKEGVLVKLGIWPSTTYFSGKWKKKNQKFAGKDGQLYIHEWGDSPKQQKNRVVAFKPDKTDPNKGWVVAWGRGRLTPHGIEDLKKS
jgi:hypothetical protein